LKVEHLTLLSWCSTLEYVYSFLCNGSLYLTVILSGFFFYILRVWWWWAMYVAYTLFLSGEHCSPEELGRLLQLILGCAINCHNKQG
jgi:hypothetical protein